MYADSSAGICLAECRPADISNLLSNPGSKYLVTAATSFPHSSTVGGQQSDLCFCAANLVCVQFATVVMTQQHDSVLAPTDEPATIDLLPVSCVFCPSLSRGKTKQSPSMWCFVQLARLGCLHVLIFRPRNYVELPDVYRRNSWHEF